MIKVLKLMCDEDRYNMWILRLVLVLMQQDRQFT